MFEKEAEDSFKCKKVLYKWETDKHSYIDGFEDGAQFGYNKCKEEVNQNGLALQSDMDKTIEQNIALKKENTELKEKLETTEKTRDYWKDSSFDWRHKCTSRKPFRAAVKAQEQLTKAKELIKEMLSILPKENIEGVYEITEEAEHFLREVEQ